MVIDRKNKSGILSLQSRCDDQRSRVSVGSRVHVRWRRVTQYGSIRPRGRDASARVGNARVTKLNHSGPASDDASINRGVDR